MGVLIASLIGAEHSHMMSAFLLCASTSLFAMRWSLKEVTLCTLNADRLQFIYAQYSVQESSGVVSLPRDLRKYEVMLGAPDITPFVKQRLHNVKMRLKEKVSASKQDKLITSDRLIRCEFEVLKPLVVGADFSDVFNEPYYDVQVLFQSHCRRQPGTYF